MMSPDAARREWERAFVTAHRLTQAQAVGALDAIVWTDPRVARRDVIHAANVVLWRASPPVVRAAWERVRARCDEKFQPTTEETR